MVFAGIDIGSRAAKAVLLQDGTILSSFIGDTGPESVKTAYMALQGVLKGTGLTINDIQYTMATGYGRVLVPFADDNVSEISAHAKGINWYYPSVRTILDMGGQDCKAISCDNEGQVTNFVMNDKCAGGTGRFLEMIADVLDLPLTKIGEVSLQSTNDIPFNTICAVFAKSDAVSYLKKGVAKSDILSGLHEAIAVRCLNLIKRVSIKQDFTITGGISKNKGMVAKIKEKVGLEPRLADDPQIIGALGAAIYARERFEGGTLKSMKVNYGYSDGSGEYYITVDNNTCDGCGACIKACPNGVFTLAPDDTGKEKAAVKDDVRKRLALVCPGISHCTAEPNCHSACPKNSINHSW